MKLSYKLACAITLLLAVSLSLGGFLLVRQNFQDSLDRLARQNSSRHLLEKYSLESELLDLTGTGEVVDDARLRRYGQMLNEYMGEQERWVAFYDEEKREIFSSIPESVPEGERLAALQGSDESYIVRPMGEEETVMLIASSAQGQQRTLWLLSAYPVTPVFAERQRQIGNFLRMELIILAGAVVVIVFLASRITRPLRRLNLASRKIASGAYDVRTGVTGEDEVGQLARNFDKMAGAVQQKVEALNDSVHQRDDFMSAFTHEIKTPMTSIIGYSDLLRSGEYAPQVRQKAANYIYHEAKRLEGLSQKLLMLMGLSEEQPVLEPVQLNSLFAQVGRSAMPVMEDVVPRFQPAGATYALADRDLAVDLLRNLLLNAAKAQPKDNAVQVGWQKEGNRVRILVTDTGRGIPPDEIKRITEPFYMVDKSRARAEGGSGLGLALCQRIAALHGDNLRIESEVGKGTTVSFTMPLVGGEEGL